MRLGITLTLSTIFLSGCLQGVPQAPVVPACSLVAIEGTDAYLYCVNSDNSGNEWRVKILDAHHYVCTSPDGYAEGVKYQKELVRYIQQNCQQNK